MSDNTAVSWSDYSAHLSNVEYEIRHRIAKELLEHIEILDQQKSPECFVQGVQRARNIVLMNTKINSFADEVETQEKLF